MHQPNAMQRLTLHALQVQAQGRRSEQRLGPPEQARQPRLSPATSRAGHSCSPPALRVPPQPPAPCPCPCYRVEHEASAWSETIMRRPNAVAALEDLLAFPSTRLGLPKGGAGIRLWCQAAQPSSGLSGRPARWTSGTARPACVPTSVCPAMAASAACTPQLGAEPSQLVCVQDAQSPRALHSTLPPVSNAQQGQPGQRPSQDHWHDGPVGHPGQPSWANLLPQQAVPGRWGALAGQRPARDTCGQLACSGRASQAGAGRQGVHASGCQSSLACNRVQQAPRASPGMT